MSTPKIAIIGAGCGGLAFAIALKRKLAYKNFVIYESAAGIGGTWRANTYPGCSSDIMMHFYSLSSDLRNWKSTHGYQPEILAYWQELTEKYNLLPNIEFNSKVIDSEWDDVLQQYRIVVENVNTGAKVVTNAHIVISSIGVLNIPYWPDVPGTSNFRGTISHSARWRHDVELKGQRVAVVGSGPTAVQVIPRISEDPTVDVTNFVRTPSWIVPSMRADYSAPRLWMGDNVPGLLLLIRILQFLLSELLYFLVFSNAKTRRMMEWLATSYMRFVAPKKYHAQIIPKHQLGCKRILFDTNYLSSFHRPNVSLYLGAVKEIVEDGIITSNGEKLGFDIIIMATGFVTDDYPIPVKGRHNQTIREYYQISGGPTAYLGTTIPGFPNFFMLDGPNISTGHTSIIYSHEVQTDYILQLIKPILYGKATSIEVKVQPTDEYNVKIKKRLEKSVFLSCTSWYRTGRVGKITNIFPGSGTLMWWWLRSPVWKHYEIVECVT